MAKIIKEIIIMLLVCLVGILLYAVIFYKFSPNRKVVQEVIQYNASEQILEQLSDNVGEQDDKIIKTYEVTSTELNNYKAREQYVPGKANPFASVVENPETGATTNQNGNSNNNNNSGAKTENNNNNNTSEESEYRSNKGTK